LLCTHNPPPPRQPSKPNPQGWATVFLANCALAFNVLTMAYNRPPVLTVLLLLVMGVLFMLAGMWLTLQFRWIQVSNGLTAGGRAR